MVVLGRQPPLLDIERLVRLNANQPVRRHSAVSASVILGIGSVPAGTGTASAYLDSRVFIRHVRPETAAPVKGHGEEPVRWSGGNNGFHHLSPTALLRGSHSVELHHVGFRVDQSLDADDPLSADRYDWTLLPISR